MNNIATSEDTVSSQLAAADISILALEHPGANDPVYRERRNYITRLAREYREQGGEVPVIEYTQEEIQTWRTAVSKLTELHKKYANQQYLKSKANLHIREDQIPQLRDLNRRLKTYSDFQLVPIEGLLESKFFLSALEKSIMYCTQYIRHSSKPDYTPEPDIIHEAIGHVPAFTNSSFVAYSKLIGKAANRANAEQLVAIERLYWFTIEYGLIEEEGEVKIFGSGLLSSFGEMTSCFSDNVERKPFNMEEVINTPYDYSHEQPVLFIIPSFPYLQAATNQLIESF